MSLGSGKKATRKQYYASLSERMIALHDYTAEEDRELSFNTGEVLLLLAEDESGWAYASLKGREGWVPRSYLRHLPNLPAPPKTDVIPARVLKDTKRNQTSGVLEKQTSRANINIKDRELLLKIAVLLGNPQLTTSTSANAVVADEVALFRSVYFSRAEDYARLNKHTQIPLSVSYAATDSIVPLPYGADVALFFHFPNNVQKNIPCSPMITVKEAIATVFKFTHTSFLPKDMNANGCMIRLCGKSEYLREESLLYEIRVVREALKRRQTIEVALEPKTPQLIAMLTDVSATPKLPPSHFANCHTQIEAKYAAAAAGASRTADLLHSSVKEPFETRILSCERINLAHPALRSDTMNIMLVVEATLYHGGRALAPPQRSDPVFPSSNPEWNGFLVFPHVLVCDLPRAARLCITLIAKKPKEEIPLGFVNCPLVDFSGRFNSGVHFLKLWPNAFANPIAPCVEFPAANAMTIGVEFSNFSRMSRGVTFQHTPLETAQNGHSQAPTPTEQQAADLLRVVQKDALHVLTSGEATLVWHFREYLRKTHPRSLPKVLLSCTWNNPSRVKRVLDLLHHWPLLSPEDALELLDSRFPDTTVRNYATRCLAPLSDETLVLYLLQLVQALKYEPYLASPLMSFLLERALHNRKLLGHALFWHARAELHRPETALRYALLLETYLRAADDHIEDILAQHEFIQKIVGVCQMLEPLSRDARPRRMAELLSSLVFLTPQRQLPLDSAVSVKKFIATQCRIMDSSKAPLWLVLENADPLGSPVSFLFKCNDDLRQDVLVMQMLKIMDSIWQKEGFDLHLSCYGCVSTGDKMGMIEVVSNAKTIAAIQKGAGGITAAFKETPLANWLREAHTNEEYEQVVENFTLSCAGYTVGTYVLGIGDRHNDNIMVSKSGHLFHIDFGHFLGKIKYFAGIKRERSPFVLTPDFAYMMGGRSSDTFKRFVALCCTAYNILRKHSNLFINLFSMMLSTGIPELQTEEDIEYLRRAFMYDFDDTQAAAAFTSMIYSSLNTVATQVNFAAHIMAHPR